jgi:hypothetical protein
MRPPILADIPEGIAFESEFQQELSRHVTGDPGTCLTCGAEEDEVEGCMGVFLGPDADWYGSWLAHMPQEARAEYLQQVTPDGQRREPAPK